MFRPSIITRVLTLVLPSGSRVVPPTAITPRHCVDALEKRGVESASGVWRREPAGNADLQREQVLGAEARVDRKQRHEAAQQESGADRQHHGQRDLADDERGTNPLPHRAPGDATCRVLERCLHVPSSGGYRRHDSHENAGERRDCRREHHDGDVRAHLVQTWQLRWRHRNQQPYTNPHEPEAEDSARTREQETLGEHLREQPPPSRPECGADCDFLLAGDAAGQQQIGDVDAGDQQHESDTRQEQHERGTYASDGLLVERDDIRPETAVHLRVLLLEPADDPGDLVPRLLDRCVGREPPENSQIVRRAHRSAVL